MEGCAVIKSKIFKGKDGFTLIELMVAVTILVIVAAGFIGLFTTGFFGVASAGIKSKNITITQENLERKINVGATGNDFLTITFPDSSTVSVNGEIVTRSQDNVTILTFIPHR
jgi:prepilin-type N-terminal cleavage/methylation domain-containing protein